MAAVLLYWSRGHIGGSRPLKTAELRPGEWNILLVSLDTTRPDRLEACGGETVATPALNRVLGDGFLFREMITPAPNTLPAHSSLMTGQNPYQHGVRENVEHRLPEQVATLAEDFAAAGYATAAFVAAFVINHRFGLAQGFEIYEDRLWGPEPGLGPQTVQLRGGIVAGRAIRWLTDYAARRRQGAETRPFFLFVHFFDAHDPYTPPPPYDRAYPQQPYEGELAYQDACLGQLLDAVETQGEAARTLLWVISDHGEALGEHGELQHSVFIYDCTTRIVSILRLPSESGHYTSGRPRMRIGTQTSLISVAPTLLTLAGIETRSLEAEGGDLLPLLQAAQFSEAPVYCESLSPLITYHWAPLYGVRTTEWKYIRGPIAELYDLTDDPHETVNVIERQPAVVRELGASLDAFLAHSAVDAALAQHTPTEEERERLRSLGYLSASGPQPAADELPDPKEMIRACMARYQRSLQLLQHGEFDEAIDVLHDALPSDPLNTALHLHVGKALRSAGKLEEAGRVYREALRMQPHSQRAWHDWGQALLQAGKADSAEWAYEQAMALQPDSPDAWIGRGAARWDQGRFEEAAADFDSALARGGDPVMLNGLLVRLYRDDLPDPVRAAHHLGIFSRLRGIRPERALRDLPTIR